MFTKIPSSLLTAALVALLASGTALGQRGERGGDKEGRGGGGGDRGASARSGDGGQSSRSSNRGAERSGSSVSGSQRSSRSFEGGQRSSRSIDRGQSQSSSEQLRRSFEGSRDRGSQQSLQFRGRNDDSQRPDFGRSGDSSRTGQFGNRSNELGRDRSSFDFGDRDGQTRQRYESRRPNEDQVRDFLQNRGDRGDTRGFESREEMRRNYSRGELSDRLRDFNRERGDDDRDEFRGRDRDFRDRDRDRDDDEFRWRDRDFGDRNNDDEFRRRDRDFRDRDDDDRFRDRDRDFGRWDRGGRRDYDNWRQGVWLGERGEGRDHRDWSGRWRDGDRFRVSHRIRNNWYRDWDQDHYPFYGQWWNDRGHNHRHWGFWGSYASRHNRPYYWWTWAAAPRLASWVTYGWPQYYYWDYGQGEYIYYNDGFVYVNGQRYQPAPVFYERTVELVNRAPNLSDEDAAQKEWLPLGVYAVTPEGEAEADTLVQLAVTQDGVIGGTAFVQKDDGVSYPIEGIVEKETQRAVWSYTNDQDERVLMETSAFNLTQPEATGLVQYGPENFRVIQLVRLEQPNEDSTASAGSRDELPRPSNR